MDVMMAVFRMVSGCLMEAEITRLFYRHLLHLLTGLLRILPSLKIS